MQTATRVLYQGARMDDGLSMGIMTSAEAQQYCETVTKRSGSNFAYSFLFLSPARRAAMYTIYAFCKEVDSAVDDPPSGSNPHAQLAYWKNELASALRWRAVFAGHNQSGRSRAGTRHSESLF